MRLTYLVCIPKSWAEKAHVASKEDHCLDCGKSVWRAASSPEGLAVVCIPCLNERVAQGEEVEMDSLTQKQYREIEEFFKLK